MLNKGIRDDGNKTDYSAHDKSNMLLKNQDESQEYDIMAKIK